MSLAAVMPNQTLDPDVRRRSVPRSTSRLSGRQRWRLSSVPGIYQGNPVDQQKHSGVGISSFVISIASGILTFLLLVVAGVMQASGRMSGDKNAATVIGLFLFAFLGLVLVALGLGIAGLMQKERKKIFALLGTIFSTVTLVLTLSIIAVGMAAR